MTTDEQSNLRAEAIRRMRFQLAELERIGPTRPNGLTTLLTAGERESFHSALDMLARAGEDTRAFRIDPSSIIRKSKSGNPPYDGIPWHTVHDKLTWALERFDR